MKIENFLERDKAKELLNDVRDNDYVFNLLNKLYFNGLVTDSEQSLLQDRFDEIGDTIERSIKKFEKSYVSTGKPRRSRCNCIGMSDKVKCGFECYNN